MSIVRTILPLVVLCCFAASVSAQGDTAASQGEQAKEAQPFEKSSNLAGADLELVNQHDPAVEQANFDLLDGFEVNLFAADPMLANPVHMTWSPDGKLYVSCSWAYPQLKPGEEADDKIIVLEDTDHDGRADESTVFADGLYIPTGLELANGGVYVSQSPHVLFLKDTDGDGRADHREIVMTGFGIEDSHHTNSAWRRGPGGWIYFQEGRFLHTQVETPFGMVRNYNGGVYQFNPRTGRLQIFANINVGNPWGHVFDRWGQSFLVDNPRVSYLSPTTGNESRKRQPFVLIKTEKQCGGDLVSGTHFPPELQGQLLSGRFKSRTVIRYEIHEDGAGFTANVLQPLLSSRHPNFRPVDVKIGPDGAVYVADWYNPVINHAQHDFRDPRRDKQHGRIWRITAKDRPLATRPQLVGQPIPALLQALKSPNAWTRHHARKVLSERDWDQVAVAIEDFVKQLDENDPEYDHHVIESLWTLQNVQRVNVDVLKLAMTLETGQARAAALRVLRYWHDDLNDPASLVQQGANDPFPRVRMEAVLSASYIEDVDALLAAMHALDHPMEPEIEIALEQAIEAHARQITEELQFASSAHQQYALRIAGLVTTARVRTILRDGKGDVEEIQQTFDQFAANPDRATTRHIMQTVIARRDQLPESILIAAIDSLTTIGRRDAIELKDEPARMITLLNDPLSSTPLPEIFGLLAAWETPKADRRLSSYLEFSHPYHVRVAAARGLGDLATPRAQRALDELAAKDNHSANWPIAIEGLVRSDLSAAAELAARYLQQPASDKASQQHAIAVVNAFIKRRGGSEALTEALADITPHATVAEALTEHFNRAGTLPPSLAERFRPASNQTFLRELLAADPKQLASQALQQGDAARGETVYRSEELACASCHGIAQVGPRIGPDLAAVGSAADVSYLVDSVLRPDKAIAEQYETYVVLTVDGQVHTGTLAFENERAVALRTPDRQTPLVIPIEDIQARKQGASLMPKGLMEKIGSRQRFLDLVAFLSALGRPGPYMTSTRPVIRLWQVLPHAQSAEQLDLDATDDEQPWTSAYAKVRGELPADQFSAQPSAFLKATIDVQQAGEVKLQINSTTGLRLWVDGREIRDLAEPIELSVGQQEFVFLLDNQQRGEQDLRVELVDASTPPARYKLPTGP